MRQTSRKLWVCWSACARSLSLRPNSILKDRGYEHDKRNVEREAIAAFRAVYGDYLVGIGGDGRQDEAASSWSARSLSFVLNGHTYKRGAK